MSNSGLTIEEWNISPNEMNNEVPVKIKRLKENNLTEFVALVKLFEDVFEMKDFSVPDHDHLQNLLKLNNFYAFIALRDNQVVGGLTTYVLEQYYSVRPLAYIFDLAVDTNFQRQGIGKKLIAETNKFYKEKGFEEVFVQADRIDDYAIDFYRKTNPSEEEQVVHFYYTLDK